MIRGGRDGWQGLQSRLTPIIESRLIYLVWDPVERTSNWARALLPVFSAQYAAGDCAANRRKQ
jgi:hypothetical protein